MEQIVTLTDVVGSEAKPNRQSIEQTPGILPVDGIIRRGVAAQGRIGHGIDLPMKRYIPQARIVDIPQDVFLEAEAIVRVMQIELLM
jgi:hypothetical protein